MEISPQIEILNARIINSNMSIFPNQLLNGKMGICIYFYHISKFLSNDEYYNYAEQLLANICDSVSNESCIDFNNGLSGIAWGILHLYKKGFVTGNIDAILQEIDDVIFRTIHFSSFKDENKTRLHFLGLLLYYADRYPTMKSRENKILMERTIIYILNHLEDNLNKEQWIQPKEFNISRNVLPLYLLILSRLYKLEISKDKIINIWESLSDIVLSTLPLSGANTTFFLLGLQSVLSCFELPKWKERADWLSDTIQYINIIETEFFDKELTFGRGLAGYIWILSLFDNNKLITDLLKQKVLLKIEKSQIWKERFNHELPSFFGNVGFFNGYTGVSYIYYWLLNYKV